MSKLIIDMPMPQNCEECAVRIWDEDYGCCHCPFTGVETLSIGRQAKCPIKGELPEEHGNLIDGDLAKARIHKNIIDYYENASGGYYLAEDAEEEVGLMVEYETIIPATERSER